MRYETALVLALMVVGCGNDRLGDSAAGAARPADAETAEAASLSPRQLIPEMRVDGNSENLVPVRAVLVTPDGTVVVGQPQEGALRYFDASGEPVGVFGRRGQGPGEFLALSSMGWRADSVWVHDAAQGRVTLVSPDRDLVRTFRAPTSARAEGDLLAPAGEPVPAAFSQVVPLAMDDDGWLLASLATGVGAGIPEEAWERVFVGSVSWEGDVTSIRAVVPLGRVQANSVDGVLPLPFPNRSLRAVGPDGRRFASAHANVLGAQSGTITLAVWDATRDENWTVELPFSLVPIPPAHADSVLQLYTLERFPPALREAWETHALPPAFPPLRDLVIARDGNVWLGMRGPDGNTEGLVLGPNGESRAAFALPATARLAAADNDLLWTVETDPLGVESIVRYRLDP